MTEGASETVHAGDVGTKVLLTFLDDDVALDISGASEVLFIFKKPGGHCLSKTAVFYTDGSDGVAVYIAEEGFFDEVGKWGLQGRVVLPDGAWSSDSSVFSVVGNLCRATEWNS